MADNNAGAGLGLSADEYNQYFGGSTTSSGNSDTNWVGTLGQLFTAGANAYRTANQPARPAANKNIVFIAIGGVLLLVVLMLALRK